jgi:hypothetical protein
LIRALAGLAADRPALAELTRRAWCDGSQFNSETLARTVSDLIHRHLA